LKTLAMQFIYRWRKSDFYSSSNANEDVYKLFITQKWISDDVRDEDVYEINDNFQTSR